MKTKRLFPWLAAFLVFALGIGLARAAFVNTSKIYDFNLLSGEKQGKIIIKTRGKIDPLVEIEKADSSIRVDFIGSSIDEKIANKPFSSEFIRLGYWFRDKRFPDVTGLRIFPRKGGLKSLKRTEDGMVVTIAEKTDFSAGSGHSSESLLNPSEEKYSPVFLSLTDSPALPVIMMLAEKAEIEIKFSRFIPENISLKLEAANAKDALKIIAEECGGKLVQEGKAWWMVGAEQ